MHFGTPAAPSSHPLADGTADRRVGRAADAQSDSAIGTTFAYDTLFDDRSSLDRLSDLALQASHDVALGNASAPASDAPLRSESVAAITPVADATSDAPLFAGGSLATIAGGEPRFRGTITLRVVASEDGPVVSVETADETTGAVGVQRALGAAGGSVEVGGLTIGLGAFTASDIGAVATFRTRAGERDDAPTDDPEIATVVTQEGAIESLELAASADVDEPLPQTPQPDRPAHEPLTLGDIAKTNADRGYLSGLVNRSV